MTKFTKSTSNNYNITWCSIYT